jgi:non-ribosomal peptide synthetase component E (peptide arylation enzyme)
MAVFKRPERLKTMKSLPRTEVGKIEKQALKERLLASLGSDEAES